MQARDADGYLKEKDFACERCGESCKPLVQVSQHDIERISSLGYSDFLMPDPLNSGNTVLRKEGDYCLFLKKNDDGFFCSIYEHRPEVCRKYPFFKEGMKLKSCRPKEIFRHKFHLEG